ncbi:MAG: tetratricopeptide repeat protein [Planctomycetota bacterium]
MTEDKIRSLLQRADKVAGPPARPPANLTAAVRRRAHRRRKRNLVASVAAAATILIAVGVWSLATRTTERRSEQERIASLEAQLHQLQARADATLNLIKEVLEREQQQRRLAELQAKLASIGDPLEEVQEQVEKTAFILVYQADRMYLELDQKDSAVRTYRRVVELFPQTRSADTAKQRLSEIQNSLVNKNGSRI